MTTSKKTTSKKIVKQDVPVVAKPETISISQIAKIVNRSPKVLRAIARNEAYRASQGLTPRLPAPVAKHVYAMKDLDAFKVAIAKQA